MKLLSIYEHDLWYTLCFFRYFETQESFLDIWLKSPINISTLTLLSRPAISSTQVCQGRDYIAKFSTQGQIRDYLKYGTCERRP